MNDRYTVLTQDDADTLDDLTAMEAFTIGWDEHAALPWTATVGAFQGQAATLRDAIRIALRTMLDSCQKAPQ